MTESKIETSTYSTNIVGQRSSPISFHDDVFQSIQNSKNVDLLSQGQYGLGNFHRTSSNTMNNQQMINRNGPYQIAPQNMDVISQAQYGLGNLHRSNSNTMNNQQIINQSEAYQIASQNMDVLSQAQYGLGNLQRSNSNTMNNQQIINQSEAFQGASQNMDVISQAQYGLGNLQRTNSNTMNNQQLVNWDEAYQGSIANNAAGQFVNQINIEQYPINQDPNPEHIHRQNNGHITYRQDVAIRYLQPPTPPPSGPVIIREIRAPQAPDAPPLIVRQRPPAPVTPPPVVIRERPPLPPAIEPARVVNKYLPAPPPPPRKVIIERQAPLPQKPQPVIIEKWLPYKAQAERRVIVERAEAVALRPLQRNVVITYDAPRVDIVKNFRELGTVRADPHMYTSQYGAHLTSSDYVLNTMARFGIGNNYSRMIQMQSYPQSSISYNINNNNLQTLAGNQQTVSYGERHASNSFQSQSGDHTEYLEKHFDEIILPDGTRRRHSSVSGSNEQEVLRQAELFQ